MIARISGKLVETGLTEIIVDVHGVGYRLFIPMSTYDKLPLPGNELSLLTYLNVREDAMHLYGFATTEEKQLFGFLIAVNGVGPKTALNVLSSMPVSGICNAIAQGDIKSLKRISGIGPKSAERLIIELRDKVGSISPVAGLSKIPDEKAKEVEMAVLALEQLGFKRDKAQKTVAELAAGLEEKECSSENLIRKSLQLLNG
ncbi:MAG: Holliday junction DNA helicase RuvA [Lentisphaerae bacterium GWF2_52_8]|nr:MAG: Holliday junction DNA helicase RuvA [Lentisphaerae bacterium GWF2_52_8]